MKPCNHCHVFKGPCTLELKHAGGHVWTNPAAEGPRPDPRWKAPVTVAAAVATRPRQESR